MMKAIYTIVSTLIVLASLVGLASCSDGPEREAPSSKSEPVADSSILANLPPDPGEAGRATLEGIDSGNNGVRDDVQRWIALTFPDSEKTRASFSQRTISMQQFLIDAADPAKSLSNALQMDRAAACLAYVQPEQYYDIAMEHKAIFLNTYARSKAWLQADHHLSGTMTKGLSYENRKQGCNFDPDSMLN